MALKEAGLICLFVLFVFDVSAQHTLVLDKPGRIKRLHYDRGDSIMVKFHSGEKIKGMITDIDSGYFYFGSRKIAVEEVKKVYKERQLAASFAPFVFVGGLIYGTSYLFNGWVFGDGNPVKRKSFYYPTSGALAGGGLLKFLSYRRYRIGRCCTLKTLELGNLTRPAKKLPDEEDEKKPNKKRYKTY